MTSENGLDRRAKCQKRIIQGKQDCSDDTPYRELEWTDVNLLNRSTVVPKAPDDR